ncbi:unnamed protein product [Taenia asiatica]|uniref:Bestrophin homolog n=1 Tax=Taenia asiatica TaxID=60517 RepID=A0A0R3W0R1_TAEAS|nr:unnamed protein product [Taenia asiatica]
MALGRLCVFKTSPLSTHRLRAIVRFTLYRAAIAANFIYQTINILYENRSAPDSFAGDFESPVDLDWDHEPGAFTTPQRQSFRGRGAGVVKSWYTSPFESSFEMATAAGASSRCRNCRTLPPSATATMKDAAPMMTQSACFSSQMVDSGFADP